MADRCPTCGRRKNRSTEQNRRYFALLNEIADKIEPKGVHYSSSTWHLYFKGRFLGMTDIPLPNGKVVTQPNSTANLAVDEFNDYMTQVEAWAAEKDVYLDS